tara:strand:+ start:49 stop:882 length:834 start_codon:yes stop_codon:yes gene_type:complete
MKIIKKAQDLKNILLSVKKSNKSIGLVLTMGNIHKGHLSLIEEAKANNRFVLVTIFINPTQFNNQKDYNSYPKTLENDVKKLQSLSFDLLYLPEVNDIYPKGLIKKKSVTKYRNILCDKFRPGHFDGVTTVVDIFFNIVKPNNSYFGEKDFQQVKFINELVKIKNHKINIIECASIRDHLGMSLSSRNSKLNKSQLEIFKNLANKIEKLIDLIKQKNTKIKLEDFKKDLSKININKIDYFEIRDEENLEVSDDCSVSRLFIALYIDKIRIIDNFKLY